MSDPYQTLGVDRAATPDQIKQAYRRLAAKNHPDKGGDTAAFQRIQSAYEILSDPQRRAQHDQPQNQFHGGFPGFSFNVNGVNIFDEIFRQHHQHQRQQEMTYRTQLWVTLEQAAYGANENISLNLPIGLRIMTVNIPQGIQSGQQIRFPIEGGNLIVEFFVKEHPVFKREDQNILYNLNVNVLDLLVGVEATVPTLYGHNLTLRIPAGTQHATKFRMAGHGIRCNNVAGDQFVLINAKIPDTISETLASSIRTELGRPSN
jgi:DnaJ-class molecular chaperone